MTGECGRAARVLIRPIALLGALVVLSPAYGQTQALTERIDLSSIRRGFYVAVDDPVVTEELAASIESAMHVAWEEYPATIAAYAAALEGLKGKHDTAPVAKLRHVRGAVAMFQRLGDRYPGNLEVRFLRYAFYEQLPVIFEVGRHVPDDLEAVISLLQDESSYGVPVQVRADMIDYVLRTSPPDVAQRSALAAIHSGLIDTIR